MQTADRVSPQRLSWAGLLCIVGVALASPDAMAQQDAVVQLKDDPYRRLVVENTVVRVWDVMVPLGESTPFHEHKTDTVSVRINSTEITNVPKGGLFSAPRDFQLESGTASYSDYSKSPYIHRITPKGPNPHRVIEIELLGAPGTDRSGQSGERPGFTQILDNPRIRASRLVLEPAQSTDLLAHGKNTLFVVVKGGRISEQSAAQGAQSREFRVGEVRWHGEPTQQSLLNSGTSRIELVEVELK